MNPWDSGPSAGSRVVSVAFSALAAAIMLSLAVALVREILPWLIAAGVLVVLGVIARWLYRRSQGRL